MEVCSFVSVKFFRSCLELNKKRKGKMFVRCVYLRFLRTTAIAMTIAMMATAATAT